MAQLKADAIEKGEAAIDLADDNASKRSGADEKDEKA